MPPRSSGSSSSRSSGSSSRSSSSRSSGSSSRSSSSSSRSSYSRSSYSSSSHSSSSSYSSSRSSYSSSSHRSPSRSSRQKSKGPTRLQGGDYLTGPRRRVNQPVRPKHAAGTHMYMPVRTIYCNNHDYDYYDQGWIDERTGHHYKAGYYDEKGKYYDNLIVNENGRCMTTVTCEYCGSIVKLDWKEGAIPNCPNCGAPLSNMVKNMAQDKQLSQEALAKRYKYINDNVRWGSYGINRRGIFKRLIIAVVILFMVVSMVYASITDSDSEDSGTTDSVYSQQADSIYVKEIDRECKWSDEYGSYYDEPTDCYFLYNEDLDPPAWQYWYEGVSSDYGDYGWMEYDEIDRCWYIETDADQWIVLPDKYDTSYMWHIQEGNVGTTIYVKEIDRDCVCVDDVGLYYDEPTDCYFIYNDWIDTPTWQYWYEDISPDFGDDGYGWMEFDEQEQQWYVEVSDGEWIPLPDTYDTSELWHLEEAPMDDASVS